MSCCSSCASGRSCDGLPPDLEIVDGPHGPRLREITEARGDSRYLHAAYDRSEAELRQAYEAGAPKGARYVRGASTLEKQTYITRVPGGLTRGE